MRAILAYQWLWLTTFTTQFAVSIAVSLVVGDAVGAAAFGRRLPPRGR